METDYISRKAAIDIFLRLEIQVARWTGRTFAFAKTIERIKEIPAADVVSRDCYDRILAENDDLREQLNAYKATGLSPERVAEYAKADREGRYIVLKEPERAGVERLTEIAQADREGRLMIRPERLTNADKIRTMTTDEELALVLLGNSCENCPAHTKRCDEHYEDEDGIEMPSCYDLILAWLKREADNEQQNT